MRSIEEYVCDFIYDVLLIIHHNRHANGHSIKAAVCSNPNIFLDKDQNVMYDAIHEWIAVQYIEHIVQNQVVSFQQCLHSLELHQEQCCTARKGRECA
jgi:hypothetical protein